MRAKYNCTGNKIELSDEPVVSRDGRIQVPEDCDQLIAYKDPVNNIVKVKIFNRDGSEAQNCLNGMAALADLIYARDAVRDDLAFVLGQKVVARAIRGPKGTLIAVDTPEYKRGDEFDEVTLGNRHKVYWDEVAVPYKEPGVNEEYVHFSDQLQIGVTVYEAGVGKTESCGSGAAAVGYSAYKRLGWTCGRVFSEGGGINYEVTPDQVVLLSDSVERIE